MATREQVLAALRETDDYARAAAWLGIPPGQAYLIVTGFAADGSGGVAPEDRRREGFLPESNQLLYGAPDGPARSRTTMSFVLDRVEADTPMRDAAQRRDAMAAEPQDDDEATTEVTTVLGRDHSRVKALLEQLQAIPGRSKGGTERHVSRRASIVDLITVELSGHEALEEQHLWPVVRRALAAGEEVADMALAQEQEGKQALALLGQARRAERGFRPPGRAAGAAPATPRRPRGPGVPRAAGEPAAEREGGARSQDRLTADQGPHPPAPPRPELAAGPHGGRPGSGGPGSREGRARPPSGGAAGPRRRRGPAH